MSVAVPVRFDGFSPDAVSFLAELAENNDRAWFAPRKAEYERLLKRPLEALCSALAERFAARGLPFVADPARSPFRIYRDVRFSKDKSPYKTHLGANFPWIEDQPTPGGSGGAGAAGDAGGAAQGIGGYFHFQPGEIFVGGGMWHPEGQRLAAFRRAIDSRPDEVHAAFDHPAFARRFGSVNGDRLKRVPTGFAADHPDAELLKLKDVVFGRRLSDEEAFSPDLPDFVADALADAAPVMRLLSRLPA